jgi:SAM-dependent methyltransferase
MLHWLKKRAARRPSTANDFTAISTTLTAREVFTDVYLRKAWIHPTTDRELYSGPGSNPEFGAPYAEAVRRFALEKQVRTIVDLGCGDFRVGQLIAQPPFRYVGVDVVDVVVDYNNQHYASTDVAFVRKDISADALPPGDLCLVREVFQHLSNAQISAALDRMRTFRWCLVTNRESGLENPAALNVDRPQGAEGRASLASALRFNSPPFNRPSVELLFDLPAPTRALPQSTIKTYLITH